MIKFELIRERQKNFIQEQKDIVNNFVSNIIIPNKEILSCLISGSVARGDYWPGKYGGAIDLTIFVIEKNKFNAHKILGKDIEPHIPGHFIRYNDNHYQIKIYDNSYLETFSDQFESEKYAFFESYLLFDRLDNFTDRINKLKEETGLKEIKSNLDSGIRYINYFINPYKVDRWKRRNAIVQLNQNLDTAITRFIKCLYYLNGKYAPAEDRALYYSYSLQYIPPNYEEIMDQILLIKSNSLDDYEQREKLFKEKLLNFIKINE